MLPYLQRRATAPAPVTRAFSVSVSVSLAVTFVFALATSAAAAADCPLVAPYRSAALVAVTPATPAHLAHLRGLLAAPCSARDLDAAPLRAGVRSDLIVTQAVLAGLRASAAAAAPGVPPFEVITTDLQVYLRDSVSHQKPAPHAPATPSVGDVGGLLQPRNSGGGGDAVGLDVPFYKSYWTLDFLELKWLALQNKYNGTLRMEKIGQSVEKHPIFALRLGRTSATNPRRVLINALQHAREWPTVSVATYIAEKLALSATQGNATTRALLAEVEIIIVPMLNPDGYKYSHTADRLWRKNRRPGNCTLEQFFRDGVDLNRNWGVDFGGNQTAADNPCYDVYTGPAAFSEPETAAIRNLVRNNPGIRAHLDIHSYSQLVLGPWAYTKEQPPRAAEIDRVGEQVAEAMTSRIGLTYRYGRAATEQLMYLASGVMTDWMFDQGAMAFTIELRPKGTSNTVRFDLPAAQILDTCAEGMAGAEVMFELARAKEGGSPAAVSPQPPTNKSPDTAVQTASNNVVIPIVGGLGGFALVVIIVASVFIVVKRAKMQGDLNNMDLEARGAQRQPHMQAQAEPMSPEQMEAQAQSAQMHAQAQSAQHPPVGPTG